MKLLPKRFINLHHWLGPLCAKELKEAVVSSFFLPGLLLYNSTPLLPYQWLN
jgi:hypothetical protein